MKSALTAHAQLSRKKYKLSYEDPFDAMPDDNVKEVPVVEEKTTVIKSEAVGEGQGKIVSTYKFGAGYDASWTVVHAVSVDDWFAIHEDPRFKALIDKQRKVQEYVLGKPANQTSAPASPGRAPQQSQEAPGGEKRYCSHGEMEFKTGVAKATGKPYSLFSCTAPRESQCKAQFLK